MVKMLGSVLILGGGVLARYLQALDRRRRLGVLADLLRVLERMDQEIRLTRTPLPLLLERQTAGRGEEVRDFLLRVSAAAGGGEDLESVWRQAAEDLPLSGEDRAALASLGECLRGDEEAVRRALALAASRLRESLEAALRRRPEEDKRATALCLSGAALLVILLV